MGPSRMFSTDGNDTVRVFLSMRTFPSWKIPGPNTLIGRLVRESTVLAAAVGGAMPVGDVESGGV
ncbi:MAG: hypothetical protein JWN25_2025 [Verrucomicrobiales bacterium]|nr:hypothetical protein [Verrucomicrobiales bacterium]